jgi:hypothetical protein
MYNTREEKKEKQLLKEKNGGVLPPDQTIDVPKATWMADGTHWPGTWYNSTPDHAKGDHAGILQVQFQVFIFLLNWICSSIGLNMFLVRT